MCVRGGTEIISALFLCEIIIATCSPFRSSTPDLEISSQKTNCNNVIFFPTVEYPVLGSNIGVGNGYDSTQKYGPFRPKDCVAKSDEEDESYKDPKWWKTFAKKLKSSKATEASAVSTVSATTNSVPAQNNPEISLPSIATAALPIDDIISSNQTPEVINPVVALIDSSVNSQSSPLMSTSVQSTSPVSTEPKSNSENSITLSSVPTETLDNIPIVDLLPANADQGLFSSFSDASSLAENNQLTTLEDVNTAINQNDLSPLDSVASAITNLILNPSSVQKRTPTNDTSISEKASFVWMAIPYVDENSTASVIPLVVLKFPPVVINNSIADNSTIEKIVVDSLQKQDVQDIISATKIKEALLNKTISVVDYYKPLGDDYDSILELSNHTEANITTTDNTFAFLVDKSNSTSLLIDKIKNEVIKSKEVKPESIEFYVNDMLHNTDNTTESTANNTKTAESDDQEQNSTKNIDSSTVTGKKPKDDTESGGYFKTIVIKIIRKSDNLTDSKQLDIGDVNYKTDNLVIQIIDEKTEADV